VSVSARQSKTRVARGGRTEYVSLGSGGITVMTWNIHGSARPSLQGIASWIELGGASVVLLQEVQQRQATQLAELLGWESAQWSMKHAPVVKPAEGLAILSPHPIALVAAPVLSEKAQRTSFRRRIAQIATIHLPRAVLQVCNVHLASGKSDERPGQVRRLMDHLAGVELLGGDFNDGPHSDTIESLLGTGFRRAESDATAWSLRDGINLPSLTIDHLLVRGIWKTQVTRTLLPSEVRELHGLSDHLPVIAQLAG
jgi:endonuclease/exonuclease/phosphatase family metal-dependent hydrolase